MADVIFLNSAFEGAPGAFDPLIAAGRVGVVEEEQLPGLAPGSARGLVVTSHVDQIWLEAQRGWVAAFLDAGGRLFFNGHVECAFLDGLARYRPLRDRNFAAFQVTRVEDHAIWAGHGGDELTFRKGVAGFYGRGQNPPPPGATVINVLDSAGERAPVDWEWARPRGGRVISHAGNDLWVTFEAPERNAEIVARMVSWLEGRS